MTTIEYVPHHIHEADEVVSGNPRPPTLEVILTEIESALT